MYRRALGALGAAGAGAAAWVAAQPSKEPALGKACFDRHVAAADRMLVNVGEQSHKRIARVQERIAEVEPALADKWHFCVVQSESSNVLSLPGGYTIINSGVFDALDQSALDLLVAREMALSERSRGIPARLIALAHAIAPSAEVILDVTEGLLPSNLSLLAAERRALSLLAKACFDPTEVAPRIPALVRVAGGDPADAVHRAELVAADVPAALEEAGGALLALADGADSDGGKRALLRAMRDARASMLLLSLVDYADKGQSTASETRLLDTAARVFERLAADKAYHSFLTQTQSMTSLLSAACAPTGSTATAACQALRMLAAEESNDRAFKDAEVSILTDLAATASSEQAAAAAQEAAAMLLTRRAQRLESRAQRTAQVRQARAKIEQQLAARRQKESKTQEAQDRRKRISEWFGPLTRKKRAMAGAAASQSEEAQA